MIVAIGQAILCLGIVSTSLWAALARSRPQALWALASNSLCLALVALTLRAPLMAGAWGISTLGLATLACHAADAPPLTHDNGRRHWPALTIVVIGALLLVVGGLMIAVDSPIWWRSLEQDQATMAQWLATASATLGGRYAPGLLALVLLALTLLVGERLQGRA